ncbi:hypothetical protein [Kitasatospora sp. NPDC058478]|uniref:hypothetical protein n=1 Tax=unclassified Kitasatospora TaxID=2633591 RepID=UPI003663729F
MLLPALINTKDDQGRWTCALDYSSILDPLIRDIATERADSEDIDHDLDQIADLAQRVKAAPDRDAAEDPAAELSERVDQFLDSLGHRRHEFPAEPNRFDIGNAHAQAAKLHAMADKLTAWASRHAAKQAA